MLSLDDRIKLLEADLLADPPRLSPYADLPFAILRYDPGEEWKNEREPGFRRKLGLLMHRLEDAGKRAVVVSLADLLWQAVDETEGMLTIVEEERDFGYEQAEGILNRILSDVDFAPLPDLLGRETGTSRSRAVGGIPGSRRRHGARYLSHVETPGRNAGPNARADYPLLPRQHRGNDRLALHGSRAQPADGELPGQDLRMTG